MLQQTESTGEIKENLERFMKEITTNESKNDKSVS